MPSCPWVSGTPVGGPTSAQLWAPAWPPQQVLQNLTGGLRWSDHNFVFQVPVFWKANVFPSNISLLKCQRPKAVRTSELVGLLQVQLYEVRLLRESGLQAIRCGCRGPAHPRR